MKRMLCSKACMLLTVAALASGVRGAETTLGVGHPVHPSVMGRDCCKGESREQAYLY